MNILKRFSAVVLAALVVFSAGISTITHAADETRVTGRSVKYMEVDNDEMKGTIWYAKDGQYWYDSLGNKYDAVKVTRKRLTLERVRAVAYDYASSNEVGVIYEFRLNTGAVYVMETDEIKLSLVTQNEITLSQ